MGSVVPFRARPVPRSAPPGARGSVYVAPSMTDGGSWDVIHARVDGTVAVLTNRFAFAQAEVEAQRIALLLGADLDGDEPKGAA